MSNSRIKIEAYLIPPKDRHATILQTFIQLPSGEAFELINDHDPLPLYYQFKVEYANQFSWEYLQKGPELFRVLITKK